MSDGPFNRRALHVATGAAVILLVLAAIRLPGGAQARFIDFLIAPSLAAHDSLGKYGDMPVMSGLSRDLDDTGVIKPRASRDQNIRLAELDRRGLVQTFSDEFTEFSWHAEGAVSSTQPRKGTWRTNFGLAGVQELGSRTLPSNKEMEIYVDPGFRGTARNSLGLNPFSIVDGVLEIIADRAPDEIKSNIWNYPYTSGLITSRLSFSQLYGVFEIRARMPKGRGLWPCFWLLPTDRSWPPEIDILEILGHETTKLYSTMHTNETGSHVFSSVTAQVPDTSVDFHTYAVDWEKETITWYFDGTEIGRVATPADLHKPMYILANLAVGGTWPGSPDASTRFPAIFAIDWIRAYRRNLEP